MDSYFDIKILSDPELTCEQVMSVLFTRLHEVLAQERAEDIGISFPTVFVHGLGRVLRIHGQRENLDALQSSDWMKAVKDYCAVTGVSTTPANCKFRVVRRIQAKGSAERIRRRAMKRHKIDEITAKERIPDNVGKKLTLPYVRVFSSSTQQPFRLFIDHGPLLESPVQGKFNAYGLSANATVPWF